MQKSLAEGFGLTVAEAMWKQRAVVASRVGGIQDQIVDGTSGVLVSDPHDLREYGEAVVGLLSDRDRSAAIGRAARERVRAEFLGPAHLEHYFALITTVDRGAVWAACDRRRAGRRRRTGLIEPSAFSSCSSCVTIASGSGTSAASTISPTVTSPR